MIVNSSSIGILYEHPEWFNLLFAELDRRGIQWSPLHAERLLLDPEQPAPHALVVNRMSPSSHRRGHGNGIFTVRDYLWHLEQNRVDVVNGSAAYAVEISKARQLDLFRQAGVSYPKARVVNHPSRVLEAAQGLQFPLVFKPNVGGSGAGIIRFDSLNQLAAAEFDFGVDGTALVQEFLPARDGSIVRVEVLNGEFLYAIRIWPDLSSFNLCPADICQAEDMSACPVETPGKKKLRIEREDPPRAAIAGALALARAAHLDVGGIEYLVNDRTGEISYYDINALSNFVTDAVNIVGFDPTARFVDYLEQRTLRAAAARA
jgi:hypothetical protein